ncbi:hypothetical protein TTHERM_000594139 (macronuclear) [Tetrahymena thermophila SB210]|uniref:Uncharacterized protein n=1 Tax=Tetrahymena thermophila (strain SB210) TaxID=312017 RepID=W7XDF3_TETTS|nr:hypothetical protein TTHERM_000594139 [Tetrahymena thermophila SB210]EWS75577.1 hypothetical protein TTHERM_000594139 [Tetrahymena thermophila SB210]|eukprot:XP_012651877.1 hypothetical protein TTHERM_000594139 [Tetrahymena thermophila SB210]
MPKSVQNESNILMISGYQTSTHNLTIKECIIKQQSINNLLINQIITKLLLYIA